MMHDFFNTKCQKVPEKSQQVLKVQHKNAKKGPQVQKKVQKAEFHSICDTIHTRQESRISCKRDFFVK